MEGGERGCKGERKTEMRKGEQRGRAREKEGERKSESGREKDKGRAFLGMQLRSSVLSLCILERQRWCGWVT